MNPLAANVDNRQNRISDFDNKTLLGVRFLHLTDLHVGMANQGWLWPTFKKVFLDDIRALHRRFGNWDVVVFSGDLTQRASRAEYESLTQILQELWKVFGELGFTPYLFPVPGNHDLSRPAPTNAAATVLGQWWSTPKIHKDFWESDTTEYRKLVMSSFQHYLDWYASLAEHCIPLPLVKHGMLPGDISAVIEVQGLRLGLVGLNSAWLHLSEGDYKGKLHVDARQLLAVTNNDADSWCASNNFNLLVTHHPIDWLSTESRSQWRSEIDTHTRFDCHLHGHMHEPSTTTIREGGAISRRSKQGASLFGLESVERTGFIRTHGYSACQMLVENDNRFMRHWPRKAHKGLDGTLKLIPDHDFNIGDEGYFEEHYSFPSPVPSHKNAHQSIINPRTLINNSVEILSSLRLTLPASRSHIDIRRVEQDFSYSTLVEKRSLWLVADWGLGAEHFLKLLQDRLSVKNENVYKIDCQRYFSRNEILTGVQEQIACSFEQLCELIAAQPTCILLLEDVLIGEDKDKDSRSLQADIEQIADVLLQYCVNINLIIKSRIAPIDCALTTVELRPLDEADTANYVTTHEHGSGYSSSVIGQIFRHTDGIPARLDSVLRDIKIVGVTELHRLNIDVAGKIAANITVAPGLAAAIHEMQRSPDPAVKRAFELLTVLAVFPRGEQLSTIKRFNSARPFYPQDARYLMDLALVDAMEVPSMDPMANGDGACAILVRRPVREYLYTIIPEAELKNLNKRVLNLYFGDAWALKGIKPPKSHRFDDRLCGAWQIGNANMMVLRATREAIDFGSRKSQKKALELANAYCAALYKGDHFKGVLTLCGDIIPLYESLEGSEFDLTLLRSFYGCALRMSGEYEKSRSILLMIKDAPVSKELRQSILIDLALCHAKLKEYENAISSAREIIKLNSKTNLALQAQALIARMENDGNGNEKALQSIEEKALKQKAYITANNLALDRAADCTDTSTKRKIYEDVISLAMKYGDHHNRMIASLRLGKLVLDTGANLNRAQLSSTIAAYHYMYNDSISGLFNLCHEVLWRSFEFSSETDNLLRLFRYSSLIWRLRGQEKTELKYLNILSSKLGAAILVDPYKSNREITYFLARTNHVLAKQYI